MNTNWTEQVDRSCPLPEYPRPQMARSNWVNLNGPWDYAVNRSTRHPTDFDGEILVPFSPETELSGVGRTLHPGEYLWYRRTVQLPESFRGRRVLLHFGAVDQCAVVWVNDSQVAGHTGGYLSFEADVTDALADTLEMTVTVRVTDDTDKSWHSRGKQKTRRGGIWYTPQSGIWQTVWAEAVPNAYIRSVRITPQFDRATVEVTAELVGDEPASAEFGGVSYPLPAEIPVPGFEPWSPENPRLYGLVLRCGEDEVHSYFAMRKYSVEPDENGAMRLFLNGRPYFQNGLLDQGYWPDGLYTAPTDEALSYDIRVAKSLGFNMLRKHIKVEPARWYYHCDRLGMLVWQDMPSGGGSYLTSVVSGPLVTGIHLKDSAYAMFARNNAEGRKEYQKELGEMVRQLYNCPCIAMWVPFNEGWGQFDAADAVKRIEALDKTRPIDHASGWHDQGIGRLKSEHVYFRPYRFKADKLGRAVVLSEFGGYAHAVRSHEFGPKSFGYKKFETLAQLEVALEELYQNQIVPAAAQGLSAAVYTQVSDVEDEINGLMTYDRKVTKISPDAMKRILNGLLPES